MIAATAPQVLRTAGDGTLDVGVDLDGCAYPFQQMLRIYLHESTGRPMDTMPDATCWTFYEKDWGMTLEEFLDVFRAGVNAGVVFTEGEPLEGALEGLEAIASAGHRIHIITARTVAGAEHAAAAATETWLRRWDVPHTTLTITGHDKSVAAAALNVGPFIEDCAANYDALDAAGAVPYLIDRAWNADHPGRRVHSWLEFADQVNALARIPV